MFEFDLGKIDLDNLNVGLSLGVGVNEISPQNLGIPSQVEANKFILGINKELGFIDVVDSFFNPTVQPGDPNFVGPIQPATPGEVRPMSPFGNNQVVPIDPKNNSVKNFIKSNNFKWWSPIIMRIANEFGLDPYLMLGLVAAESGFRPNLSSSAGAYGLCQLMPKTAAGLGVDRYIPEQNIRGGCKYLKGQLDTFKSVDLALAAYNAGPGNVRKYKGIPPFKETQNYVQRVQNYARGFGWKG